MKRNFFDTMKDDIEKADIPEHDKTKFLKNLLKIKEEKVNIMITGATGCGKSSTINALFDTQVAKVGVGVDPETMSIEKYELENLILWDSPGLGDGKEADNRHAKNIISKLHERDENGNLVIDLVLVILDGSTRDLGTSYELINSVIIPNLGEKKEGRILVAINQADVAMKGRYWDEENNKPEPKLEKFLNEKVDSVKKRIKEGTGVNVKPIYYSAGYKEEGEDQCRPYNLTKLLYFIISFTPKEKRFSYVENINKDQEMWKDNDDLMDYRKSVLDSFTETFTESVASGTDVGREIGSVFGKTGEFIGGVVGGAVGAVGGILGGVFKPFTGGCYITTAVCQEFGKPDDCYELTTLRNFRDNWLKLQDDGEELIKQYYDTAPILVEKIDKQSNKIEIYKYLNETYLSKCLQHIENEENELCKEVYIEMMNYLYKEDKQWQ